MKISDLNDEILNEVFEYFECNVTMSRIRRANTLFKSVCDSYGYIRKVCLTSYNCPWWEGYMKGIKIMEIKGITKPQDWIHCSWKKTMNFNYCLFGNGLIDPLYSPDTESICIDGILGGSGNYCILRINWEKFPNLRNLTVKIQDFSFEGLIKCKKLEYINVEGTKIRDKTLPSEIAKLPNLKCIITNYTSMERLHFESPYLLSCLIEKRYPCSSKSVMVPNRHLNDILFNWHPLS